MEKIKKLWAWLNGKKATIGLILGYALTRLTHYGVQVPEEVVMVVDLVFGLGLTHKAVKAVPRKAPALLLAAFGLAGGTSCTTSPQSAPQIPLAPVYQAGSPVVINVNVKSDSTKQDIERTGSDARGDVGASGEQDQTPTVDVKPTTTVEGIPLK
jgi:hypothetical protein